ncbi:hypothetical protein D1164_05565 [Mariniphaga sediminis]|uniref:Uncharacterized protein n=1 Tax=Mariniphaga sediminis TaxID=1628158 RepID=A0A399D4N2_9BACT|nr:hypothetical protein [Mariniphaga sediminis]RIH66373.1 hypothetical protein D1164_05565 [Mariniphaga sediminis]
MSEKSAFSASDFLTGESEKAANDNKMNKSILKYRSESPLSRDLGVKDKLANGGIDWQPRGKFIMNI